MVNICCGGCGGGAIVGVGGGTIEVIMGVFGGIGVGIDAGGVGVGGSGITEEVLSGRGCRGMHFPWLTRAVKPS